MRPQSALRSAISPVDMANHFTNLLPASRVKTLRRDYYYRLVVVGAWLCVALIAAAGALLLPTYVFLTSSVNAKEMKLKSVQDTLAATNDADVTARLKTLSANAATLSALSKVPSPTSAVRIILGIPHAGIALTGFVFTPATDKTQTTLAVSGTAATRNALHDYELTLKAVPGIAATNLPVSAYARETNIDFTITLTLPP